MERCVKELSRAEKRRMEEVMQKFGITSKSSKKLWSKADNVMSCHYVCLMPHETERPFMPSQEEYDYLNHQLVKRLERDNPQFTEKIATKVGWCCEIFNVDVDGKLVKEYRERYDLFVTVK